MSLSHIESRPSRISPGDYDFLVNAITTSEILSGVVAQLRPNCVSFTKLSDGDSATESEDKGTFLCTLN